MKMPITGGNNGYPEPELGTAIFPESKDELIEFLDNPDGLTVFRWKNGWQFCEETGRYAFNLDQIEDFFLDCVYSKPVYDYHFKNEFDEDNYIKTEIEILGNAETEAELSEISESVKEIKESFKICDLVVKMRPDEFWEEFNFEDGWDYDSEHLRFGRREQNELQRN